MKKRKILTIILIPVLGLSAFLILLIPRFVREIELVEYVFPQVLNVNFVLTLYLQRNSGCLPADEAQLIAQGYLRKIHQEDDKNFWEYNAGYIDRESRWYKISSFKSFSISYGLTPVDLERAGNLVIDKSKKAPMLIIKGPGSDKYRKHREFYQEKTSYLYDQMCEYFNSEHQMRYANLEWSQIHEAVKNNKIEELKSLIKEGADVNAKAPGLFIPLHIAVTYGFKEITEYLIQNGADVNAKDTGGFTPLHVAAVRGYAKIAEILIQHGADIRAINNNKNTPLDEAKRFGNDKVVDIMKKYEAMIK